jgi:hypothetical protein
VTPGVLPDRLFSILAASATALLTSVLLVGIWDSLDWPYIHDTSLMLYAGWFIGEGAAPYRDLFDMNMPGTYLAMQALVTFFGWSDLGVRLGDICLAALIATGTFFALRRGGRWPALAGSLLFPLWYLRGGPSISLQREVMALAPVALMLGLAESNAAPRWRSFGTGVMAGLVVSVKPQLFILTVPVFCRLRSRAPGESVAQTLRDVAAGIMIPLGGMGLFLVTRGSVSGFLDIATGYWPLYGQLNGDHRILSGSERFSYLVDSTWHGLQHRYTILGLLGLGIGYVNPPVRGLAWTWSGLVLAGAVYPALSGQFWVYHWVPLHYALLGAAALALAGPPMPSKVLRAAQVGAAAATVLVVAYASADAIAGARAGRRDNDVVLARERVRGAPSEIGAFLEQHLVPGDLVQPLDWTGGAIHGMLTARTPLATRFMYDFHFYHHVDEPYIQRLRREFMREMWSTRPRFVVDVFGKRPFPMGPRTSTDFPELRDFLETHYRLIHEGSTFRVLERVR